MRLHVLSDLHLGLHGMPPPQVEADVTILAGDILRPASAALAHLERNLFRKLSEIGRASCRERV